MTLPRHAIVVSPGTFWDATQTIPAELLHLSDRPFLHHVMDVLAGLGCTEVDVILGAAPERFRDLLGDGSRWGVQVRTHLARDPNAPYARLPAVLRTASPVLLAHACTLPTPEAIRSGRSGSGWGVLSPGTIPGDLRRSDFDHWLRGPAAQAPEACGPGTLDVRTVRGYLAASAAALAGHRADLLRTGRAWGDGVRVGWGAEIHPTATISGPVYVGERATIGPGAVVGPHTVIGHDAIVSRGATVSEATVEPGTYVGDSLTVRRSVVREGWLMDGELGAGITVDDRLLLGATSLAPPESVLVRSLVRLVAAAAWMLSLPLQLVTAAALRLTRPGPVAFRTRVHTPWHRGRPAAPRQAEVVTFDPRFGAGMPVAPRAPGLADLVLRVLPGLLSVARGDLALVGPEPRSRESVASLPPRWREIARAIPPGLITELDGVPGVDPDPEQVFAAEAFLAGNDALGYKLGLLGRYLRRCLRWSRPAPTPAATGAGPRGGSLQRI